MKISDIKVEPGKGPLVLATPREVDEMEERLWITFPVGYREYVTQIGEGVLGGAFVRVYPPWRITQRFKERQFEPFDSRTWPPETKDVVDPKGQSLDDIVELGRQWARRHGARKILFDDSQKAGQKSNP